MRDIDVVANFEEKASRLPSGYTEVEYISNPNLSLISPFLDTLSPFADARIEMQVDLVDRSKDCALFGNDYYYRNTSTTMRSNANKLFYYQYDNYLDLEFGYSSNSILPAYRYGIPAPSGKMDIVVDYPKRLYSINDTNVAIDANATLSTSQLSGKYPVLLGEWRYYYYKLSASSSASSYNTATYPANCKLYKFKIYTSTADNTGDLTMDLVPCINPDGKVGVYDIVNNVFFTNSTIDSYNTRLFEAGPAV